MKKLVAVLLTFLIVLTGCTVKKVESEEQTDAIKFSSEYKQVPEDNKYKYVTYDNVIDTLKSGSGVILLSYPSCVKCNIVAPVLNDAAKEKKVKEIFYYNYKSIKKDNTDEYKELVKQLEEYLLEDEEGNKIISAPTIIFVQNGNIKDIKIGLDVDEEEFTDEKKTELKNTYLESLDKVYNTECDC